MKAETKYVAFNGAVFDNPEAAKQYETLTYLKLRREDCKRVIKALSFSVRHGRGRIQYITHLLTEYRNILRDPVSKDIDVFNAKARRFKTQLELERLLPAYINEKRLLRKYHSKLSYYENRIAAETKKNNQ
jgi:hypothetical protein